MKNQTLATLALLRARGEAGLTPAEARDEIGTDRLAARIYELREEGFQIERKSWMTPSHKIVARYVLRDEMTLWPSDGRSAATTSATERPSERHRTLPRGLVSRLV